MEIVGFAKIKENASTCKGAKNPSEFINKICPVFEFADDGGVLVLNPQGTALAMFDKEDIETSFRCGFENGIVFPPDLGIVSRLLYSNKLHQRKGGYNVILSQMVIAASLHKGVFNDSFLFTNTD